MTPAKYEQAAIRGGGSIRFDVANEAGSGGMKRVFFLDTRQQVVAFFHEPKADPTREARLDRVIGIFNPTRDGQANSKYWRELFCWPSAIVDHPIRGIGILLPVYPESFFFECAPRKGCEKIGQWFNGIDRKSGKSFRHVHVHPSERGEFRGYVLAMVQLARAVQRLHSAGLAHSDLSENNVLVDPVAGRALVIDVDSLVVRGVDPPDVMGTPGFIAPEVISTKHLPVHHGDRKHPCAETDKHALAVMIYKYLLERHPLEGLAFHSQDPEADDDLVFGSRALYCEHKTDNRNRPRDAKYLPALVLGSKMDALFYRAFDHGLSIPAKRPSGGEWVDGLSWVLDNLVCCEDDSCPAKWFVLSADGNPNCCPYCGWQPKRPVIQLRFEAEGKKGWFRSTGELVANASRARNIKTLIHRFHVEPGAVRGPGEDADPLAELIYLDAPHADIYLHNLLLPNMKVRDGLGMDGFWRAVPIKNKVLLRSGLEIWFDSKFPTRAHVSSIPSL